MKKCEIIKENEIDKYKIQNRVIMKIKNKKHCLKLSPTHPHVMHVVTQWALKWLHMHTSDWHEEQWYTTK